MKHLLYISLLILVLPFTGLAQNDSIQNIIQNENKEFKNQIDFDVEFLGVEFTYKHEIGRNIFLGIALGAGFNLFFSKEGSAVEILKAKLILGVQLLKYIYVAQEIGYSLVYGIESGFSYRIGTSIYYGRLGKVKIGFKPAIMIPANEDKSPSFKEIFVAIPLISVKIPIKQK